MTDVTATAVHRAECEMPMVLDMSEIAGDSLHRMGGSLLMRSLELCAFGFRRYSGKRSRSVATPLMKFRQTARQLCLQRNATWSTVTRRHP